MNAILISKRTKWAPGKMTKKKRLWLFPTIQLEPVMAVLAVIFDLPPTDTFSNNTSTGTLWAVVYFFIPSTIPVH